MYAGLTRYPLPGYSRISLRETSTRLPARRAPANAQFAQAVEEQGGDPEVQGKGCEAGKPQSHGVAQSKHRRGWKRRASR